jgi:hypothetical protein
MFISIDAIGSTELKSKSIIDNSTDWRDFFLSFYQDFRTIVADLYTKHEFQNVAELWKNLGDELIFISTIIELKEIEINLKVFIEAIKKFNSEKYSLKVKGSSWLAETPVSNLIIIKDRYPQSKEIIDLDFIGASIDIGFRISKFATDRKFIISVEVAKILVENANNKFTIFFDGELEVKGVLDKNRYPIIWIDIFDGKEPLEEKLFGLNRNSVEYEDLEEYCDIYIDKHKNILTAYKIPKKENYKEEYKKIIDKFYSKDSQPYFIENEQDGKNNLDLEMPKSRK